MRLLPIRTHLFLPGFDIEQLMQYVAPIQINTVVCISTKLISLMENCIYSGSKHQLVLEQSQQYLGRPKGVELAIIQNILMPNAGIDESNLPVRNDQLLSQNDTQSESATNDEVVLSNLIAWPKDCFASAKLVWDRIRAKTDHDMFAVLLTDTRSSFMRRGTVGICTGCYGINPLKSYINHLDLFSKPLRSTKVNIADSLAAAAVMLMGEGNEQTPVVIIQDALLDYQATTQSMIQELAVDLDEDLFGYGEAFDSQHSHKD